LRIKKIKVAAVALGLSHALLLGCGGGGDGGSGDSNPSQSGPSAEGVYGGTLTGSTSSEFQALVFPNGDFWSLYGYDAGSIFYVDGFVQGSGASNNGTFTASNLRDFGFAPAIQARMTASYNTVAKTINGTSTYDGQMVQFSGGPIPGSLYRFDTPATLGTVAGHWDTVSTTGSMVSINISAGGTMTLSDNGCTGSGSITPHASGKNAFSVVMTFGGAPCVIPNQTVTGIAVAYPLSTGQTQVIAAATNSARTLGIAVFGIR
jgi:hypothetical protein